MPRIACLTLALLLLPLRAGAGDYIDRTPSKNQVTYTLNGATVWRFFILPDGRVYPGKIEGGECVVWDRAGPLFVSEYAYGGPISRIRLIETRDLPFYRTEAAPKGLKRVSVPKG